MIDIPLNPEKHICKCFFYVQIIKNIFEKLNLCEIRVHTDMPEETGSQFVNEGEEEGLEIMMTKKLKWRKKEIQIKTANDLWKNTN